MSINQKGFSIVELLITIGLAAILLPALLTGFVATRGGRAQQDQRIQAIALAQETQEEIRVIRESGWDSLPLGNNYYPKVSGFSWVLASLPEIPARTDGFIRVTNISKVFRDEVTKKIVETGGSEDPSTKKITTTVSWGNPIPYTVTNIQYLTRNANEGYVETTVAQFSNGTPAGTQITNNAGGEIILGPSGAADWCQPETNLVSETNWQGQGVPTAISAETNRVFAGTGQNSSGPTLVDFNTTDPQNPILNGIINNYKANGVFVDGTTGYVAADKNSKEIVIVNLSSHLEIGSFDAPGNGNGNSVFVSGNYGYMISSAGNKLYNFNKIGGNLPTDNDGVTLDGSGNKVFVVGNYAYVAIDATINQLDIIDLTNPTNLTVIGRATVAGQGAKDIFINSDGTRAYLVTATSASQKEFFIIDITNKSGNSHETKGSFEAGGLDPTGLTVIDNRAIIVGKQWSGDEYIVLVVDSQHENNPPNCGHLNFNFDINGVSSVLQGNSAYSFIITGDSKKELKIIAGGSGGSGGQYVLSGMFESQTIPVPNLTQSAAFNSFSVTSTTSCPTICIAYKVAVKPSSGSCSGVVFSDSDFVIYSPGPFPFNTIGQCVRYRAYLSTTDGNLTPVLSDITFNYSK